jgi:polysaccharide export outer membrane protein
MEAMSTKKTTIGLLVVVACLFCQSCSHEYNKFFDPKQVGRFRPVPKVNVILDSLAVMDEPDSPYLGAEEPRPEDALSFEQDYVFGPGDTVRISIFELRQEGIPYINDYIVTETGRVSIPDVGLVRAQGLTESQLEEEVKDLLSPDILLDPSVTASLLQSQGMVFSVNGDGVRRPGQYPIPRRDFRLARAIAMAGSVNQFNVSYIYITRRVSGEEEMFRTLDEVAPRKTAEPDPTEPVRDITDDDDMFELIAPSARNTRRNRLVVTAAEMVTAEELEALAAPEEVPASEIQFSKSTSNATDEVERIEWVFEDGKWVPKKVGAIANQEPMVEVKNIQTAKQPPLDTQDFGWEEIGRGGISARVIKVPVDSLFGGDPRYNIIIRPGDAISIPVDRIGEFWVMGNVRGQGAYAITGRPINLKQAIVTAGGLDELAWPKTVDVTRRISKNEEVTVMVDLDKIFRGLQPDFFIKPNDLINVGTNPAMRVLAGVRQGLTPNLGFGLSYTRNFAFRNTANNAYRDLF